MKKILITGANSYIGTSFEHYMAQWPEEYQVDTVDMVDGSWREKIFADYDSVFHVAGIAHQDSGKITEERKQLYFKVNTELTVETAKKAKAGGVKQFIFMSSIIVYGAGAMLGETKMISKDTKPAPAGAYGRSKLKAEEGIQSLNDDSFCVCVLRPPMIYGPGCKGNYPLIAKAAMKLPFFPDIRNERSMLFIGNLCGYVKAMVDDTLSGLYFPQNSEYVSTSEMVRQIALAHNKNIRLTKVFNPLLRLLSSKASIVDKVFGNLVYERSASIMDSATSRFTLEESIRITEGSGPA